MDVSKRDKHITFTLLFCLIGAPIFNMVSVFVFPPDFSNDYPVYSPDGVLLIQFSGALYLLALTILGMKAEEERNILAAAGFTAQAISMGLAIASLFEISSVADKESYEKFYYLTVSSNFLYVPAMVLIATYDRFKPWIRWAGIFSGVPLIISSVMFVMRKRDYNTLEMVSSFGYLLLLVVELLWAYNVYINYQSERKTKTYQ